MCDGVTMGHPCCCVQDCTIPLLNQQDWFCPMHESLKSQCCIYGCSALAESHHITCEIPSHRAFEKSRKANPAFFTLRRRLDRAGLADIPIAGTSSDQSGAADSLPRPNLNNPDNRSQTPKGCTSRCWTHSEQLFVRPCDVIVSRATNFGSEGVSGVKVSFLLSLRVSL